MRRDPRVMGLVLALVAAISGCEDDSGSAARLSPAVVWVGDQTGRFRLEGPNPVDYLRGDGHEVRLVADYAATIGGVPTQVVSVDGLGVDVTLTTSLPTGVFPLTITAGARTWRTEAALTVVADPIDSDAGLCPLAPDGCTAFTCPTGDRCYYLCGEREWSSASNQCPALGLGCLVTIGDQAEQDCVAAALGARTPRPRGSAGAKTPPPRSRLRAGAGTARTARTIAPRAGATPSPTTTTARTAARSAATGPGTTAAARSAAATSASADRRPARRPHGASSQLVS
jgi:hypothetical protein